MSIRFWSAFSHPTVHSAPPLPLVRVKKKKKDGEGTAYKGITIHAPKRWHVVTGKGMCAVMWFWIFYRAKKDGPVVLGWRHPWEGHGDHSHDSSHGHGH